MTRCWNCGLPDVAERCPRCGAPQDRPGRGGAPPPAQPTPPPGASRPPPGFIVNGAEVDLRPTGPQSGPLYPPGGQSGPLRPAPGRQSGPLYPPGSQSGPLRPPPGNQSGPPPASGYPPRGPNAFLRPGSGALPPGPPDEEPLPPEYRRNGPPPWPEARQGSRPLPPRQAPREWPGEEPDEPPNAPPTMRGGSRSLQRGAPPGWEDEDMPELPDEPPLERRRSDPRLRDESYDPARAPSKSTRAATTLWDEEERWGATDPEPLSLSAATSAVLGGAAGGLLGGVVWLVAAVLTGFSLPYLTVLVGFTAGLGARFALVQTRPWMLGLFGALGAAVAYLVAQYGLIDYALAQHMAQLGQFTSWFPLSPLHFPQVYLDYVIGVADDVNTPLGRASTHPLEPLLMLVCMAVCWALLLRRKQA